RRYEHRSNWLNNADMNAITIGPLVFVPDRFAAILAIVTLLVLSESLARKRAPRFSPWAWCAAIAFAIGARAGHVIQHGESFASEPLRALYVWQGGFLIWAGIALALVHTLFFFRRELRLALWTPAPAPRAG